MMKKLFALALSVMMLLSFAACAAKTEEAPAAAAAASVDMSAVKLMQDGVLTIGMEVGYPPFEDFAEDGTTPIGFVCEAAATDGARDITAIGDWRTYLAGA